MHRLNRKENLFSGFHVLFIGTGCILKFAFKILGVEFGKTICGDGGAEVVRDVSASFTEIGFFCIYPAKPKPTWSKIKPVYMTLILPTHIHARDIMH